MTIWQDNTLIIKRFVETKKNYLSSSYIDTHKTFIMKQETMEGNGEDDKQHFKIYFIYCKKKMCFVYILTFIMIWKE